MSKKYGNIGALGSVPFYVSDKGVQTLADFNWSGSARYATHKRLQGVALAELTGLNPDEITLEIRLSKYLGVDPWNALKKLLNAERKGELLTLTIGNHGYGRYRWVITSHKVKVKSFDAGGNLADITVSVKLLEYVKE